MGNSKKKNPTTCFLMQFHWTFNLQYYYVQPAGDIHESKE